MARLPRNVDTRVRFKAGTPIFINMAFKLNPLAFFERNDELNKMADNIGAFDNAFEKISFISLKELITRDTLIHMDLKRL